MDSVIRSKNEVLCAEAGSLDASARKTPLFAPNNIKNS
jgi:hypothetical protein